MKYKILIASFLLSLVAFAQPRQLLAPKGEILHDTLLTLNVQAPLTKVNDSTLGVSEATASTDGYLSATNWNNFQQAYNKYVLSGIYSSGTITFTRRDGTTFDVTGLSTGGGGGSNWTVSGSNIYNSNSGFVGVNNATPTYWLHVNGAAMIDRMKIWRGPDSRAGSIAIGDSALRAITSGYNNTVFGDSSMYLATTAHSNSFFGWTAGQSMTTGSANVGMGTRALFSNTTGTGNIGIGEGAGYYNSTGSNNIVIGALGFASGATATTNNVLLGTGITTVQSSNNVALGQGAGGSGAGGQNTVVGQGTRWGTNATGQNTGFGAGGGQSLTSGNTNNYFGLNALSNSTLTSNTLAFGHFAGSYTARHTVPRSATTSSDGMQRADSSIFIGGVSRALNDSSVNETVIAGWYGIGHGSNSTVLGNWSTQKAAIGGRLAANAGAYSYLTWGTGTAWTEGLALSEAATGAALDVKGVGYLKIPAITQAQRDALSLGTPLQTVLITAQGSGYSNGNYELTFTGGGGSGARGSVQVNAGALQSIVITSWGNGYTSAPTITFPAGAGTGGVITATIQDIRGAKVFCTDCTANDASTGVEQTHNGTTWKNHW